MNTAVYAALVASIPLTATLFATMAPRRAATLSIVLGYLFLPQTGLDLPGPIDLGKANVIAVGVLLGILAFDARSLRTTRVRWFDAPMVAWCLSPLGSSLANNLGAYDGLHGVVGSILEFGVPYLAGRVYLRGRGDLEALALAIVLGGLLYVLPCWFEIRMSPQLHTLVYGSHQHDFAQTARGGGWRPTVFLQHGLAVGMWMASATLAALVLWRGRRLQAQFGAPPVVAVGLLVLTIIFVKSLGALLLLATWLVTYVTSRWFRTSLPLALLVLTAPCYLVARVVADWTPDALVRQAGVLDEQRAQSLETRIRADSLLRERALLRPWFGWGGYDRFREGLPAGTASDSLFSVAIGNRGLVGLAGVFGTIILASWLAMRRCWLSRWDLARLPAVEALVSITALYALDCMANAMINPVYLFTAGGLLTWSCNTAASQLATGEPPR